MASSGDGRTGVRPSPSSRSSDTTLPVYTQGGLSDDFINVGLGGNEKAPRGPNRSQSTSTQLPAPAYLAAPYATRSAWILEEPKKSFLQRHGSVIGWAAYIIFILGVSAALGYATWSTREEELWTQEETPEMTERELWHHIWLFVCVGFASFVVSNLAISIFPYLFRAIAPLVNPGHKKYWRIFGRMTSAVTWLGGMIGTYVSYTQVRSLFGSRGSEG